MADMLTVRAAAAIICCYLVTGLDGTEEPVAAGADLQILTDIEAQDLQDKVAFGSDDGIVADIDAGQRAAKIMSLLETARLTGTA